MIVLVVGIGMRCMSAQTSSGDGGHLEWVSACGMTFRGVSREIILSCIQHCSTSRGSGALVWATLKH